MTNLVKFGKISMTNIDAASLFGKKCRIATAARSALLVRGACCLPNSAGTVLMTQAR